MTPDDDVVQRAYRRVLTGVVTHFDNAAAIAMVAKIDRKTFLEMAGMAFDWVKRWHDHGEIGP